MIGPGSTKANYHLSNIYDVAICASLLPDTNDLYDFGSDALRWKDGYFSGTLTVWDLIVESGSSIHLAGATFENHGHYTSVDTNWMVEHDDQDTAFIGVYANSEGVMAHANLVLDAQGSALNLLKNSPSHPFAPYMAGIVNEDGNYGTFVDHGSEISWQHFAELTKDEYGNITNMTDMQSLMRLTDDYLTLEDVELKIDSMTENSILYIGADGVATQDNLNLFYDATHYLHTPKLTIFDDDPILKRGHGLSLMANVEMDFDIIHVNTPTKSSFLRYDVSEDVFDFDTPVAINGDLVLTEETDPVFSAWDKSTGIIITESQISDLDHFTTGDEIDPIFSAWESSFTEGSIIFSDDTGLTEDNSKLFWDNVNNRFGIGLTNPARSIHLQDDNAVIRIDRDTNSPAFILARFPSNDYTVPWKAFIFGVGADGVDDGTFHITDIHTNVAGGGDQRFAIDTDGKIIIPGALDTGNITAERIYLDGSGADYIDWCSADSWFRFSAGVEAPSITASGDLNGNHITVATVDVTDYLETPVIMNTYGDTIVVQDNLDVTGIISSYVGIYTPEIYNSLGLLKIQPDIQGDVELFGDTNVGNSENSKIFKIWRRASEGNDYIRFYVSANRTAYIHSSNVLTLQAQNPFIINSVTQDITFKVGDNAGVKKVYFKDSDGTTVATIDSNGVLTLDTNNGAFLNLVRGTQNKISNFFDSTYTDLRFTGEKDYNRIGTWIDKPFQIVTDSINRIIIDKYGRVEIPSSLTVNDLTIWDDILAYGDIAARNHVVRRAVVFEDNSTQLEAGERHFSQGHTHTAIYNNDWYDADAENTSQRDMQFSPDGLKMYIIGLASGGTGDCCIWEYSLTVPWELSTVGTPTVKSIETYGSNQVGLFVDVDGRRLWTVCTANDTVIEYSMNPWNISSLTWVQAKDISLQDSSPSAVFWSANGDRLFIAGDGDNDIVAFSIVNEWDISGLSWFQDFGTDIDAPTGLHFSSDGRRMYVMDGSAEDDIHEFHLSSPWMIESARLVNLFDVSAENTSPQGIFITPDNSKIFMVGTGTPDGVYGYDLGSEVKGRIIGGTFKAENMPTSAAGLSSGDIWSDSGALKIVA